MLTVWSVCWGDKYTTLDVHILKRMVARNLKQPHRFRCLSDRLIIGVDTLLTPVPWPGWWQKLHLFHDTGPCLYLDLDVVIVGGLDELVSDTLSMPTNWAQSGYGGCQSSVMSWCGDYTQLPAAFNPKHLERPEGGNCGRYEGLWGDQEFITREMGPPGGTIVPMQGIYSYKYHCRDGLPSDAKVVCFHGKPKPSEVSDSWVVRQRSM